MRPVSVEFVLKGNLDKEIDRIRLNVKSFGTEGTKTYRSILNASNQAFAGLSAGAQRQAVALQKVITSLKKTEEVHESLKNEYNLGKINATQYAEASARLAVQQAQLKAQAADLNSSLQRELAMNREVKGSYNERVATLKGLKETYAQLSEEEINNAAIGGKMLNRIKELEAQNEKFEQSLKSVAATQATSIAGMKSRLTALQQKYDSLSAAERNNANVGGKLARQMKKLKSDIGNAETANMGFIESLKNAPGPIGATVGGMEQMTKAALRFIATPIGAIIAALVVAFKALTVWFHRGSAGESAFAKVTGYFSQILNTILNIASKVGEWLYKAFTSPKQALKDLVNFIENQFINRFKAIGGMAQALHEMFTGHWKKGLKDYANAWLQLGTGVQDVIGKTGEFIKKTDQAATTMGIITEALYQQKLRNQNVDLKAFEIQEKISKLRVTAMDYYGGAEKVAKAKQAVQEIIKLTKEKADLEIEAAKRTYELTKAKFLLENGVSKVSQLDASQQKTLIDLKKKVIGYESQRFNLLRRMQGTMNSIIGREHTLKDATQQATAELKLKKEAYQTYYQYVAATSKKEAQGLFSDLLKEGSSYLDYLDRKIAELKAKQKRTPDENKRLVVYTTEEHKLTGAPSAIDTLKREIAEKKKLYGEDILAFQEYLKKKKEALKDDTSEEGLKQKIIVDFQLTASKTDYQKKLNDLLQKYGTYSTKLSSLTKSYQENKKILEAAGTEEAKQALKILTQQYQLAVNELNNSNDSYLRTVFSDITRLSTQSVNKLLSETRHAIDTAQSKTINGQSFMIVDVKSLDAQGKEVHKQITMTLEEFQKLQNRYDDLYQTFINRNPFKAIGKASADLFSGFKAKDADKVTGAINDLNSALAAAHEFAMTLNTAFKQIFGKDFSEQIEFIDKMTQGVIGLGGGIAEIATGHVVEGIEHVIKGIGELFATLTQGNKKYEEAVKKFMIEQTAWQIKYNRAVNDQIRTQETGNIFITDYVGKIRNAYDAMSDAQERFNKLLNGKSLYNYLNQFQVKVGEAKKKFLGITIGSKDVMENLLDKYPDLVDAAGNLNVELAKSILNLKGLSDEAKNALQAAIDYNEEMKAALEAINSAIKSIVGSISNDLFAALEKAWDEGTSSFEAFKDTVSKGVKQIISQLLFNSIFQKSFKQLGDDLKASWGPTGDQSALDDFQRFMEKSPALLKQWEQAKADLDKALADSGFATGLMKDMTGTTSDSIADSIAQGFRNGYRSASDFAKTFKDLMKNAVMESLKVKILEKPLQQWFDKFSETMDNGKLGDNMDELNKEFNDIIAQGGEYIKNIEQATGLNFGVSQQADANSITTITEQTASKLEGHFVAVRVNTAKMAESAEKVVRQMAKNQLHLAAIEKNTNQLSRLYRIETILDNLQNDGIKIK